MGVRIVCCLITYRRISCAVVRLNIISVRTFHWHFPQPIVADRNGHVTGVENRCVGLVELFSDFTWAELSQERPCGGYDAVGRVGGGTQGHGHGNGRDP
jgi:hypothetical protein